MSGTHRDLLFWSRILCFVCKNQWLGLGPIETCYSGPEVAVLHAKTTGGVYSPAETCNSSPKVAVLHAQNHK